MDRSDFLKTLGILGLGMAGLDNLLKAAAALPDVDTPMPGLFIGHGSPLNIVADNAYTRAMKALGLELPRPKAILVISAHWLSRGSYVSSTAKPSTIHDFFGFPEELYQVTYPAPGSPAGAKLTQETLLKAGCMLDVGRGLDHGAWSVLHHMYPAADIPVFQLSIDRTKSLDHYFQLGRLLRPLRAKGILVMGSGNIVHNLSRMQAEEDAPAEEWAEEFDVHVRNLLERGDVKGLLKYTEWGKVADLAHPSNDHYLPLLYSGGLLGDEEAVKFVHEGIVHGSVSMRCVQFG
jgi:4,5-DOPA dioxygenase extradiol